MVNGQASGEGKRPSKIYKNEWHLSCFGIIGRTVGSMRSTAYEVKGTVGGFLANSSDGFHAHSCASLVVLLLIIHQH